MENIDKIEKQKSTEDSRLKLICQDFVEEVRKLTDRLEHIGERIKTEDVYQRQMELALTIHRLCSKKKTEYMKVSRNFVETIRNKNARGVHYWVQT